MTIKKVPAKPAYPEHALKKQPVNEEGIDMPTRSLDEAMAVAHLSSILDARKKQQQKMADAYDQFKDFPGVNVLGQGPLPMPIAAPLIGALGGALKAKSDRRPLGAAMGAGRGLTTGFGASIGKELGLLASKPYVTVRGSDVKTDSILPFIFGTLGTGIGALGGYGLGKKIFRSGDPKDSPFVSESKPKEDKPKKEKKASVPLDWYNKSPYCAAFIEACKNGGITGEALKNEIVKNASINTELASQWSQFLEKMI